MTTHLLDSLAADLAALEMLTAAIKLKVEALQAPEPAAPAAPVTAKRMPKDVITDVIVTQLPSFLASRNKYRINEFREHCKPFLPIGAADIECDCDGCPKWFSRFTYSHNQVVKRRGFTSDNMGGWTVPAGGR
jgi:hypothetical protein